MRDSGPHHVPDSFFERDPIRISLYCFNCNVSIVVDEVFPPEAGAR